MRKIKTVNKQTVGDYVQEETRPVEWGGPDQWQFQWEPGRFDGVKMPPTLFKASVPSRMLLALLLLVMVIIFHWPLHMVAHRLLVDRLDLAQAGPWHPALYQLKGGFAKLNIHML